jgi:hypothetical protein
MRPLIKYPTTIFLNKDARTQNRAVKEKAEREKKKEAVRQQKVFATCKLITFVSGTAR